MKKFLCMSISILLCLGAMGAGFALGRHLNVEQAEVEKVEKPNNNPPSSTDEPTEEPEVLTEWELCTDVTELTVGDKIVIAALNYDFAMSTTQNTGNRVATDIERNEPTILCGEDVQVITLQSGILENTFAFDVGDGYLYAASSSSNQLKTRDDISESASWLISIESYGEATIVAQGTTTRNTLRFNLKSNLFSCYESSGTQDKIAIYKQSGSVENQN